MPYQTVVPPDKRTRRRNTSWLESKIRPFRDSKRKQKQLQQLLVIIVAVVMAFILGYYFLGPSFSS